MSARGGVSGCGAAIAWPQINPSAARKGDKFRRIVSLFFRLICKVYRTYGGQGKMSEFNWLKSHQSSQFISLKTRFCFVFGLHNGGYWAGEMMGGESSPHGLTLG